MPAWLVALFEAIKGAMQLATKAIPSDKIREENQQIKIPRLQQNQKIAIYDREYRRLKDHTEIAIPLDVNFVDDNLNPEDKKELIELLTHRIIAYRKKHPIIFKKWLAENGI
jgi:hypothetical protein